jgi:hypothetical protein
MKKYYITPETEDNYKMIVSYDEPLDNIEPLYWFDENDMNGSGYPHDYSLKWIDCSTPYGEVEYITEDITESIDDGTAKRIRKVDINDLIFLDNI